nr:interferon-induced protein with tetratricopeptide repeats [Danio rerio]
MSLIQASLKKKLDQLECHFTWDITKDHLDFTNLLNRLEEQNKLDLGNEEGAARAQCSMGYLKFLLNCKEEALTHLSRSEALIKENFADNNDKALIVTYGNFAWINYHMENYTECESYLVKLQKIHERFATESSAVPEVLGEKGWTYLKFSRKYYDKAVEVFQKAVELDPSNSEWNAGYAIALYRTENFNPPPCTVETPAIKQLRQAIDLNPDDDVLRVILGIKLLNCSKGLMNESEQLVEKALNQSPEHPHVIRYVGMFLRDQGSVDRSIEILKKALQRSPKSGFICHQLAMCYKTKKINLCKEKRRKVEVDEARDQSIYYLEEATSLIPSFISAVCQLGLQYGDRRDLLKAEEQFDKAFKLVKEKNEHLQSVHLSYAQFQQYSNRREDLAIEHYEKCLTMNPHTPDGNRSAQKLCNIAKKNLKLNPNDWKANEILGLVYNLKGEMFERYGNTPDNEDDSFLCNLLEVMSL